MDDLEDDLIFPLSMSGIALNSEKKEMNCSQSSVTNRLSKTYRKEKKDNTSCSQISSLSQLSMTFRKERKDNISFSQLSSVNKLSKSLRKKNGSSSPSIVDSTVVSNSDDLERETTGSIQFCPTCQAPFDIMKVDPNIHANQCALSRTTDIEECPNGEVCYSESIFHYRDYAHTILAQIRSSRGHLETIPNVTPSKTSGNKMRKSSTFKAPSCNLVGSNISNCKKKLFSDNESVMSLSTDSSKEASIKTSLNRVSNLRIGNAHSKSSDSDKHIRTPTNKDIKEQDKNQHLKGNQVIYGPEISNNKGNRIIYGPEISNTITVNKNKRLRVEDSDTESQLSSPNSKNSDFKMPTKKKKIENNLISSGNTNVKNHNLTSSETNLTNNVNGSFSNSQKINKKDLTLLDVIDFSVEENLASSEEEFYTQKEKDTSQYEYDNKVRHDLIEECKNCKTSKLPHIKKEHSVSVNAKEVRATLSVVVSPTSINSDDGKDPPETPVKVDASCDQSGWKTIGIAAPSTTEVDNVKVSVCNCNKTMEVKCLLSKNQTLFDVANNGNLKNEALEQKYFSHVKEPKQFNKLNANRAASELANHQMSITSYFRTSKQPSTLSLKTSIESASTEVKPCSSSMQTQKTDWIDNDIQEVTTTTEMSKQRRWTRSKVILRNH